MTQAVGSRRISLLLRSSSQEPLLGRPVWMSMYAFCSSSWFSRAIFSAMAVWSMIRITRHSISSAERISIVRIFMAIFSE